MSVFQFQSINFPDHFIRHRDFLGELTREAVGETADFSFQLVERGHDQQGRRLVSLRSVNFPDRYLRHRDFHLWLEPGDSPNLAPDATFIETVRID